MGAVHSVDSCSSGNERHKDDFFQIPSKKELEEYERMTQKQQQQQQQRLSQKSKPLPRAMPDASRSVQHRLGVEDVKNSNSPQTDNMNSAEAIENDQQRSPHHRGRLSGLSRMRQSSVRRVRQASVSMLDKVSHAASALGHSSKRLFALHHHRHNNNHDRHLATTVAPKVRGGVLLRGCYTDEEHREMARDMVELLRPLHGEEALTACGFEYRTVNLSEDEQDIMPSTSSSNNHR